MASEAPPAWWTSGGWCWLGEIKDAHGESMPELFGHLLRQWGPCCQGSDCPGRLTQAPEGTE